ncbi:hypothetical protein VIBRN418_00826 [Vibrio sp. N418]|uniref:hypothetical protein n=1 Tax=Vibrio sp. (strain N418) TaxID=701176 RepID=UPI00021C0A1D|nr:hypothetical protein [Vibrio sp. N418]EGU33627.1 hypothetical protein VIBRN418_00826 [Vibrio sp. N418]
MQLLKQKLIRFYFYYISKVFFSVNDFKLDISRSLFDFQVKKFKVKLIDKKKLSVSPSIAAIIRVKNGASNIENTIRSVESICSEIIIIDNASTDETLSRVSALIGSNSLSCPVHVYKYDHILARAGDSYASELKLLDNGSLADYYNYCFNLSACEYLWKVDVNCIYLPSLLDFIQINTANGVDIIRYFGVESFGRFLAPEPSLFKKDTGWKYYDTKLYEEIRFENYKKLKVKYFMKPGFFHIKRVTN